MNDLFRLKVMARKGIQNPFRRHLPRTHISTSSQSWWWWWWWGRRRRRRSHSEGQSKIRTWCNSRKFKVFTIVNGIKHHKNHNHSTTNFVLSPNPTQLLLPIPAHPYGSSGLRHPRWSIVSGDVASKIDDLNAKLHIIQYDSLYTRTRTLPWFRRQLYQWERILAERRKVNV